MRTKRDKIFDNKFDEIEYDSQPIAFKVDSTYDNETSVDDSIHDTILFEKIEALIKNSKFSEYADYTVDNSDKLNKSIIKFFYIKIFTIN